MLQFLRRAQFLRTRTATKFLELEADLANVKRNLLLLKSLGTRSTRVSNTHPSQPQYARKRKTLPPVDGRVVQYNLVVVRRANSFAVHTTAEGSAGWASHVWECLRTAVRASHSLHGRRLPISATRMRISTRGLVFRQCHSFSSISFKRLSLSVLYITARTVQLRNLLAI